MARTGILRQENATKYILLFSVMEKLGRTNGSCPGLEAILHEMGTELHELDEHGIPSTKLRANVQGQLGAALSRRHVDYDASQPWSVRRICLSVYGKQWLYKQPSYRAHRNL